MALTLAGLDSLTAGWPGEGLVQRFILVAGPGGVGALVYLGLVSLLRVDEVDLLRDLVSQRLRRRGLD